MIRKAGPARFINAELLKNILLTDAITLHFSFQFSCSIRAIAIQPPIRRDFSKILIGFLLQVSASICLLYLQIKIEKMDNMEKLEGGSYYFEFFLSSLFLNI